MKYKILSLIFFLLSNILFINKVFSQINFGGMPYTFGSEWQNNFEAMHKNPAITLPTPDMQKIKKEDSERTNSRFAYPIYVNYNLENSGTWTTINEGHRIWRLTLQTQNAWCLRPIFDKFYLPKGAKLFIYNADKSEVLGAFTQESYAGKGRFATDIIEGNSITIELFEPAEAKNQSILQLWRVGYGYRKMGFEKQRNKSFAGLTEQQIKENNGILGFGSSGNCNVNVNCTLGNDWQNQKRGIVKIVVGNINGDDWCSGSLINTANNSMTPYILSAKHCEDDRGQAFVDTWIFIFNYEASACNNPILEPSRSQSVSGADIIAMGNDSDFLLLKLKQDIPLSYNVYYNGWDKSGTNSVGGACIHHPDGDIKKIAIENNTFLTQSYYNDLPNDNTHFGVVWDNNTTTESGSSGSPLFDQNGRIVGQLHGGEASCSTLTMPDWFGKFSISWNGGSLAQNRLRDWLDPTNLNPIAINGTNYIATALENTFFAQNTSIFPNPTNENIIIKIQNPQKLGKNMQIEISDTQGRKIFSEEVFFEDKDVFQKEISLKKFPNALYFMQLTTQKGNFSKKIILEK